MTFPWALMGANESGFYKINLMFKQKRKNLRFLLDYSRWAYYITSGLNYNTLLQLSKNLKPISINYV
jgi:hypothetical protein